MNTWLKAVRNTGKPKAWWPVLAAKLRGHFQYYGVSGNLRGIRRFNYLTMTTGNQMAEPEEPEEKL